MSPSQLRTLGISYGAHLLRPEMALREPQWVKSVASIESHYVAPTALRAWIYDVGRVCPDCLREQGGVSVECELAFGDVCAVHGRWLVDRCSCGALLRDIRYQIDRCCACGTRLDNLPASLAPPAMSALSKLLVAAATGNRYDITSAYPSNPIGPELEALTLPQLQTLCNAIGLYGDPSVRRPPSDWINNKPLDRTWPTTALAAEVICGWPNAFHAVLDRQARAHDHGGTHHLHASFGGLYGQLYGRLKSVAFDFVRKEFIVHLSKNWRASPKMSTRLKYHPQLRVTWISADTAARDLDVPRSIVEDYVARGELRADRRITLSGRERLMIHSPSVQSIIGRHSSENLGATAARLGLSKRRLHRLLPDLFPAAWQAKNGSWQIPRRAIEEFEEKGPTKSDAKNEIQGLISIDYAIRYLRLADAALLRLIDQATNLSNTDPRLRNNTLPGVAGWLYSREAIRAAIQSTTTISRAPEFLTLPELAKLWGLKQEVVYFLQRAGIVKTVKPPNTAYSGSLVSRDAVSQFEARYWAAAAIATELGTSPRHIIRQLKSLGVAAAIGAGDGCRQAFYVRGPALDQALVQIRCGASRPRKTDVSRATLCRQGAFFGDAPSLPSNGKTRRDPEFAAELLPHQRRNLLKASYDDATFLLREGIWQDQFRTSENSAARQENLRRVAHWCGWHRLNTGQPLKVPTSKQLILEFLKQHLAAHNPETYPGYRRNDIGFSSRQRPALARVWHVVANIFGVGHPLPHQEITAYMNQIYLLHAHCIPHCYWHDAIGRPINRTSILLRYGDWTPDERPSRVILRARRRQNKDLAREKRY